MEQIRLFWGEWEGAELSGAKCQVPARGSVRSVSWWHLRCSPLANSALHRAQFAEAKLFSAPDALEKGNACRGYLRALPRGELSACAKPASHLQAKKAPTPSDSASVGRLQWQHSPRNGKKKWQDDRILAGKSLMVTFISANFSQLRAKFKLVFWSSVTKGRFISCEICFTNCLLE